MKYLIFALGTALLTPMFGASLRADDPKPDKPAVTEKDWKGFVEKMNPFGLIQRVREAEARAKAANNLRQLQLAIHNYQNQGQPKADGQPPQFPNWYMHLLPYIEQDNLYAWGIGNRLGVRLESVGEALQAQLGLAKEKGLLIADVEANSAGAKAGLKKFDILLQWDGKDVAGRTADFQETLRKTPDKKECTARVLRAGKEVELKGIALPATSVGTFIQDGTSNTIMIGEAYKPWQYAPNSYWWTPSAESEVQSKLLITTHRQEDRFTARYQEGSLAITVTGQMKKDVAAVKAVKVIEGAIEHRYESLDKTPEEYRDKARDLVKAAEKNQNRIEIPKDSRGGPLGNNW